MFGVTSTYQPSGVEGHILKNPIDSKCYMAMLCFKNGSRTREHVRDLVPECKKSWKMFNKLLNQTPIGNNGNIGFYFIEPEITPTINKTLIKRYNKKNEEVKSFSSATEVRALIEGHCLKLRVHSLTLGLSKPRRIVATGGASKNTSILTILSNVFNASVYILKTGENSAAYGAALRAMHGCMNISFDQIISKMNLNPFQLVVTPNKESHTIYNQLLSRYTQLESQIVEQI